MEVVLMGEPICPPEVLEAFNKRRTLYLGQSYAPGAYWCKCVTCKKRFDGDKRALRCFDCATAAINAANTVE
jgi:hypothetical protein